MSYLEVMGTLRKQPDTVLESYWLVLKRVKIDNIIIIMSFVLV